MQTITIHQMSDVMDHIVVKQKQAVNFIGQFGVGKTAGVRQWCEKNGAFLHNVKLGQYDTVDLKGTPWVKNLQGYDATVWHPASTLPFVGNPNFPTDRPIILFFDERSSATVPVKGICYEAVDEHRVGEHHFMPNVFVVSAGNREQDKGIVNRDPMPLCNRETTYEIVHSVKDWCQWATETYADKAAIFVAFLNFRKNLMCTYDPAKPERCVATARTIEKALNYYNADMPKWLKEASISGVVGKGWNDEFWGFVNMWQEIMGLMPSILKNPKTAKVPDKEGLQYAVSVAISGELTPGNAAIYSEYIKRLPAEFMVLIWQLAVKRDAKLFDVDEFLTFSRHYRAVFQV